MTTDSGPNEDPIGVADFMAELEAWESVVPTGSRLFHTTKNFDAIQRDGRFKAPNELMPTQLAMDHGGLRPNADRVSITWSAKRADRYLHNLDLAVRAASAEIAPVDAMDEFLSLAQLKWESLAPQSPTDSHVGATFWRDLRFLTEDEHWDVFTAPVNDVRSLWLSGATATQVSAWQAVLALDADLVASGAVEKSLGILNAVQERFTRSAAPSLAILEVTLQPGCLADVRREEEELQVLPADILNSAVAKTHPGR